MYTFEELAQKAKKFGEDHHCEIESAVDFAMICALLFTYTKLGYRIGYTKGVADTLLKLW